MTTSMKLLLRLPKSEFDKHQPQVVVGSSRSGAVAMNIKSGDARLVLLCPAWKNWGTIKIVRASTVILHSRADDVIPFADSEELVRKSGLPNYTLIEIDSDHRLADPESLELMLEACFVEEEDDATDDDILERDWTGICYTAALRWATEAFPDDAGRHRGIDSARTSFRASGRNSYRRVALIGPPTARRILRGQDSMMIDW